MRDIALSRLDHDLVLKQVEADPDSVPKYDLILVDGADAIAQEIKIRLKTFLGEWFLDITHGVPYLESILIKGPRESVVSSMLRGQILAVPGVSNVQSMQLDLDNMTRILTVNFECDTVEGTISDSYRLDLPRNAT